MVIYFVAFCFGQKVTLKILHRTFAEILAFSIRVLSRSRLDTASCQFFGYLMSIIIVYLSAYFVCLFCCCHSIVLGGLFVVEASILFKIIYESDWELLLKFSNSAFCLCVVLSEVIASIWFSLIQNDALLFSIVVVPFIKIQLEGSNFHLNLFRFQI